MFHGAQPADHGLEPGAHLVAPTQQGGTLPGQRFLALAQCPVLVLELAHRGDQFIDALFEALQFQLCNGLTMRFTHGKTIVLRRSGGQSDFGIPSGAFLGSVMNIYRNYPELQQLLSQSHAVTEPAEAHGTLAGALCASGSYTLDDWLAEVLPDGQTAGDAGAVLRHLYDATVTALAAADMRFELLMPDDDHSLEIRTEALSLWCNGFLYGLGTNGSVDPAHLPGDAGEIVRDLTQISQAGVDASEGEEANESALAELVEFVRVGVQLVFDELDPRRQVPPAERAVLH